MYITNFKITKSNVSHLAKTGRSRWKIENEGFNRQKNLIHHIEHVNSHDYNAIQNHYLLAQITDIMMQLYQHGVQIFKDLKKTTKEKSYNLLEVIRTHWTTDEDLKAVEKQIQVRFS